MKRTVKTLILLIMTSSGLALLGVGCVSQKTQHYNMDSVQEFLKRADRDVTHKDHENWDKDILRRLNDRELLLNQE